MNLIENPVYNMQQSINNLTEKGDFVFLNVLSPADLKLGEQLKIVNSNDYYNEGKLEGLEDDLPNFICSIGPNDPILAKEISEIFQNIISNILQASGKESGYVILRASTPNGEFDLPRWHEDGAFYRTKPIEYKFATVLKGPLTLFCLPNPQLRELVCNTNQNNRIKCSELLKNEPVIQGNQGQGVFFKVGDGNKNSAMHSEPKIDSERLFFSFVPANLKEIQSRKLLLKWIDAGKLNDFQSYVPKNEEDEMEYKILQELLLK